MQRVESNIASSTFKVVIALMLVLIPLLSVVPASAEPEFPELVSKSASGEVSNGTGSGMQQVEISDNGRYVAYESRSNNLVGQQVDAHTALYVYDRDTSATTLASIDYSGQPIYDGPASLHYSFALSGNGQYLVFSTTASSLDPEGIQRLSTYIRDLDSGTTSVVSIDDNDQRVYGGRQLSVSDDGNTVLFNGFINGDRIYYIRDVINSSTKQIDAVSDISLQKKHQKALSGDGSKVLYQIDEYDIDTDTFTRTTAVYDLLTESSTVASVGLDGLPVNGSSRTMANDISSDGRYVLFSSGGDLFRRDMVNNVTVKANLNFDGNNIQPVNPLISANGSVAVFRTGLSADIRQTFIYDYSSNVIEAVSRNSEGELADGVSAGANRGTPSINGDGTLVAFITNSLNFGLPEVGTLGVAHPQVFVTTTGVQPTEPISVVSATIDTNPKSVTQTANLTAEITGGQGGAASVEYFIGDDPGLGNGAAMDFDGTTASVTIGTDMPVGVYPYSVRAVDNAGNWSDVSTVYLTVYDPSGGFVTATRHFVPSLANGDVLPGLTSQNQTTRVQFGATVKYQNGSLQGNNNDFMFSYHVGNGCQGPNSSCAGISLDSTTVDWLILSDNDTKGTFQGTADVTVDGATTNNPYRVEVFSSSHATSPKSIIVKVFAPGADPSTATPLYRASGTVTGNINVHQL